MPIPLVAAGTSSAWLPYLLALGAGGTYAMNRDRINRMAGNLRLPWGPQYMDEEAFLRGDIPSAYDKPTVITANPGSTDSEFDAKEIVYPPGPLVHQPAGELVGTGGGNDGNGGNGGDDDKFMSSARWTALGETPKVISDLFGKSRDIFKKDYSQGYGTKLIRMPDGSVRRVPIETEEPGSIDISQDGVLADEVLRSEGENASDKVSDFLAKTQWLEDTRNSPAARASIDPDARWAQKKMNDDFQVYRDAGDLEGFARKYPQSQTAKKMRRDAPYGRPVDF